MTDSSQKAAAFVRGFFAFLESRQLRNAVLHGGDDGFERDLSDVDFAVARKSFPKLPALIDEYCGQAGWRLCQILRHETTAAYFVCSAVDDPTCAVALDACSDYQRNGTVFLRAETLLEDRRPLTWGGHGLSPAHELRYRFAKAAAKNKDVATVADEFARYPEEVREDCAKWLAQAWGISAASCYPVDLTAALAELRARSNQRPSLLQAGAIGRILSRILRPTGLVVVVGHHDFDAAAARLQSIFGHLYFRRFKKSQIWQPAMLRDLVASTLIVVPELERFWSLVLPANCVLRMNPGEDLQVIAKNLQQRCKSREARHIL